MDNEGDGSCLFQAVHQGLCHFNINGNTKSPLQLRHEVCKYLLQNGATVYNELNMSFEEVFESTYKNQKFEFFQNNNITFSRYVTQILSNEYTYADMLSLYAAANIYRVEIKLHAVAHNKRNDIYDLNILNILPIDKTNITNLINIGYLNENHYVWGKPSTNDELKLQVSNTTSSSSYKQNKINDINVSMELPKIENNNKTNLEILIESRYAPIEPNLVKEFNDIIKNNLENEQPKKIISKLGYEITIRHIKSLDVNELLIDIIISYYYELLKNRDNELSEIFKGRRRSYFVNLSFFHDLLFTYGHYRYESVRKWTTGVDIFSLEKIFIPINLGNAHWTLGYINIPNKQIHYYDSKNGKGSIYMNAMMQWLKDESSDKKYYDIIESEWEKISEHKTIHQQSNNVDCGIFVIVCSDFLFDDLPLLYKEEQMNEFRIKIGTDMLRGYLTYPLICVENNMETTLPRNINTSESTLPSNTKTSTTSLIDTAENVNKIKKKKL